jgi:hypothetical protein
MTKTYKTCRHCLGTGCIHCNNRGEIAVKQYSQADRDAQALRRKLFGDTSGSYRPEARQHQERRAM